MESIVRVAGLSHRYNKNWAIRDISFEIDKTSIYGLLGSNGAGKSTTMNILCRVLNQTEGRVLINGIDTRRDPLKAKKQIGFLPQMPPLYMDLTVMEYLLYCARLREIKESLISVAVEEVMEKCNLLGVKQRLLKNLSGGYRQRAGIAQVIIHKPKLVVLDEPTNGLDPVQIVDVRNLIREIAVERTVIFSSHILTEVQTLCQNILMIEHGKLIFSDSMDAFNNYVTPKSVFVEFENPPAPDALRSLKGVSRVETAGLKSFRVYSDEISILHNVLVRASVDADWNLNQLILEKQSLDEVFQLLPNTSFKNEHTAGNFITNTK